MKQLGYTSQPKGISAFLYEMFSLINPSYIKDIEEIVGVSSTFDKHFGDVSNIEDMKVSHLYILGLATLMYRHIRYITALVSLFKTDAKETFPGYLEEDIVNLETSMKDYISFKRKYGNGNQFRILSAIDKTNNLKIKAGDKYITDYASSADIKNQTYSVIKSGFLPGFVSLIIDARLMFEKTRHELRVSKKDWLETKMSLMAMEMADMDKNSKEYQKTKKIYESYTVIVTGLEREIRRYEDT